MLQFMKTRGSQFSRVTVKFAHSRRFAKSQAMSKASAELLCCFNIHLRILFCDGETFLENVQFLACGTQKVYRRNVLESCLLVKADDQSERISSFCYKRFLGTIPSDVMSNSGFFPHERPFLKYLNLKEETFYPFISIIKLNDFAVKIFYTVSLT